MGYIQYMTVYITEFIWSVLLGQKKNKDQGMDQVFYPNTVMSSRLGLRCLCPDQNEKYESTKSSPPCLLLMKCLSRARVLVLQRKPTWVSFQLFRDTELLWKVYICKSRCGLGEGEAVVSGVAVNWPLPAGHSWYKVINAFTVTRMQ